MDYGTYPEESNWKKKYELTIPIILLILVGGVLAWQMGWLDFIPGIGEERVVDVLIVGEDRPLRDEIEGVGGVNVRMMGMEEVKEIEEPGFIEDYEIIFLTEELGEEPGDLPSGFRSHVSERLDDGTNLMLYGVAGSRDPDEPQSDGWTQHGMGEYIPVECPGTGVCDTEEVRTEYPGTFLTLSSRDPEHPVSEEFGPSYNIPDHIEDLTISEMHIRDGSNRIYDIKIQNGGLDKQIPGIVENSWTGGEAVYFAYHPAETPSVLRNTIEYIR